MAYLQDHPVFVELRDTENPAQWPGFYRSGMSFHFIAFSNQGRVSSSMCVIWFGIACTIQQLFHHRLS
jgi:hypothetical protein